MAKSRNPKGLGHYYKKKGLHCWKYVRDGKPVYRSSKTEDGLNKKVRKIIGLAVMNNKTKVHDYFTTLLDEIIRPACINPITGKDGATYLQYESIFRNHIDPEIGDFRMSSVNSSDIERVILKMNTKVRERKDKNGNVIDRKIGLSTKTMKHAKTVMSIGFTRAFEFDKIIPENPVPKCYPGEKPKIRIPVKQAKPRKVLTVDEVAKFVKSLQTSRWIWSVRFDLLVGLRRGELLVLSCPKIEWENNRIRIDESNSATGKGGTKNRKTHYVPLPKLAKHYLEKQIEMLIREGNKVTFKENGEQMTVEEFKKSDRLIFPAQHGGMIKPNTYYHRIKYFGEKSGLDLYPHCFRHTFVYKVRKTLSLSEIQEALGHDESTTTLDIYGSMINDEIDTTVSKMDEIYEGAEADIDKKIAGEQPANKQVEDHKVIDFQSYKRRVSS
jgi:integrase